MPNLPSGSNNIFEFKKLQADWPVDVQSGFRMDPLYFMDLVVFQVKDCLFRIPRIYFEKHSPYFKKLYLNPRFEGDNRGSSTTDPILLEDVTVAEFRDFMTYICPPAAPYDVSPMVLNAAIRLSTLWRFNRIRASVIATLTRLDDSSPFTLVWMGLVYTISAFLKKGLLELVKFRIILQPNELVLLEAYGALKGVEKLKKGRGWRTVSMSIINEEFKEVIRKVEQKEKMYDPDAREGSAGVDNMAGKKNGDGDILDDDVREAEERMKAMILERYGCPCGHQ
ncbi:hypothetical protein CVT24_008228 [Panaeolus cyanescens]|uniref:BTB domain-containing protein n=1 Tax=Panaeolus cyanescens TaxID=181874 RepID=A0A409YR29_9AGAR|nr:hypothetical protein CVT24_008228 [Panaeolus cyanescens]